MAKTRIWQGLAIVAVVLAAAAWFLAPGPARTANVTPEPEPWQMPRPAKSVGAKGVEQVAAANMWGTVAAPASESLNDPAWRFLGIVTQGAERFVLIKVDGQPEARLSINDKLPGGSEILEIRNDSLCVLVNGQKRRLPIHQMGSQIL